MKKRDACLAKMWIPDFISQDGTSGKGAVIFNPGYRGGGFLAGV